MWLRMGFSWAKNCTPRRERMQKWLWRMDFENRRGEEDEKDWTRRISTCQRVPEKRAGRYERESASVGADVREIEAAIGEMGYPARSWQCLAGATTQGPGLDRSGSGTAAMSSTRPATHSTSPPGQADEPPHPSGARTHPAAVDCQHFPRATVYNTSNTKGAHGAFLGADNSVYSTAYLVAIRYEM